MFRHLDDPWRSWDDDSVAFDWVGNATIGGRVPALIGKLIAPGHGRNTVPAMARRKRVAHTCEAVGWRFVAVERYVLAARRELDETSHVRHGAVDGVRHRRR